MKKDRIFLLVLIILLVLPLGFFVYKFIEVQSIYHESEQLYENIVNDYVIEAEEETAEEELLPTIDWESLKTVNDSVVGWIKLPDSSIDYPVVQGTDNEYYLEHLFDGTPNSSGAVFIDSQSDPNFNDIFTPMYAHHTNNGSMFYDLERYKDQEYYDSHSVIDLYTPEVNYHLYPIAGRVMNGNDAFIQNEFSSKDEYFEYIGSLISESTFKSNSYFDVKDKVILLSTCTDDYYNSRYILVCKAVKR